MLKGFRKVYNKYAGIKPTKINRPSRRYAPPAQPAPAPAQSSSMLGLMRYLPIFLGVFVASRFRNSGQRGATDPKKLTIKVEKLDDTFIEYKSAFLQADKGKKAAKLEKARYRQLKALGTQWESLSPRQLQALIKAKNEFVKTNVRLNKGLKALTNLKDLQLETQALEKITKDKDDAFMQKVKEGLTKVDPILKKQLLDILQLKIDAELEFINKIQEELLKEEKSLELLTKKP